MFWGRPVARSRRNDVVRQTGGGRPNGWPCSFAGMAEAELVLCGLNLAMLFMSKRACRLAARWQSPARIPCNAVFEVMLYQMPVRAHRQGAAEFRGGSGLPAVISTVEK